MSGDGTASVARVVVEVEPFHLDRPFDYAIPDELTGELRVGMRVEVVFSGRRRRGLVVDLATTTDVPAGRLREVRRVLGAHVWATSAEIEVLRWAAERFGAPLADVVRHALPARTVAVERAAVDQGWFRADPPPPADGAPAASAVMVPEPPQPWAAYQRAEHLWAAAATGHGSWVWRPLADEAVAERLAELATATLTAGRDVLLIVPDANSRVADAFVAALAVAVPDAAVTDVRGASSPRTVYRSWLGARCGRARVIVGERSVAFWPLDRLGLAVVLDEANPALKERRSPRHHAREVILERARRAGAVGLLVTTVPSAVAWSLLRSRRLATCVARRDVEARHAPAVTLDHADRGPRSRLGNRAIPALRQAVAAGRYGIVLAARGGEGTALACTRCGHRQRCPTCAGSLTAASPGVRCATCGWAMPRRPPCPACKGVELAPLAAGTQRIAAELAAAVSAPVAVAEGYDQPLPPPPAVVVMTRGSVMDAAPGPIGAVVVPDLEALIRRPFVDAPEDALRLAMAVAGWAARWDAPVVVRTRLGAHEVRDDAGDGNVLRALATWNPGAFWRDEAASRARLGFPPARAAIALEIPRGDEEVVSAVLAAFAPGSILGPAPAGERERLLLLTTDRSEALATLAPLRAAWSRSGIEVRVDVDPVTL